MKNSILGGVKNERAKVLREIAHGTRVRTPQGEGEYYYTEDGRNAVVHLDEPYKDDSTGLTVRDVYCPIEALEVT